LFTDAIFSVEKVFKAENGGLTTTPPSVWAGQRSSLWMTTHLTGWTGILHLLRLVFA
jgi:hypothetical protein